MIRLLSMTAGAMLLGSVALSGTASATVYFSDNFNGYTNGNSAMTQAGTGLTVYANGDLPGWTKNSTPGNIHAVQRSAGDFAVMVYDNNLMYYGTALAANVAGASYTVSFDGAYGVYNDASQITGANDYIEFMIKDSNGTIATYDYTPTSSAFSPTSFTYTGSGVAGGVYLVVVNGNSGDGRFGGAIDNLVVADTAATVSAVPEPASLALLTAGAVGALSLRRRKAAV